MLPNERFASRLFHSNRDGTFTDVTKATGIDVIGFVKAAVAGDYDNDGRPDLYLSQARAPNRLLHNDGPQPGGGWRFTDVTATAGVAEPNDSFPAMWFDYDNDGWLDIYVAGYLGQSENVAADFLGLDHKADRSRLYRNRGNGTFADVTREAGLWHTPLAMGMNYGDLDNDGWLDFYEGTGNPDFHTLVPNRMFRNDGGKRFQEVTTAGNFGHLQKGHGIAFADLDNDGDQDVFEKMGGAYQADRAWSVLFENPHAASKKLTSDWVGLELEGVTANRAAIGARISVRLQTPSGPRRLHRLVSTGASFGSSPFRIFVGIGDATSITGVDVSWPQARTGTAPVPPQVFRGLLPGRALPPEAGRRRGDRAEAAGIRAVACADAARAPVSYGASTKLADCVTLVRASDSVTRSSHGPAPTPVRGSSLACWTRPLASAAGKPSACVATIRRSWMSSTRPVSRRPPALAV